MLIKQNKCKLNENRGIYKFCENMEKFIIFWEIRGEYAICINGLGDGAPALELVFGC